jgi:hypothetical protein
MTYFLQKVQYNPWIVPPLPLRSVKSLSISHKMEAKKLFIYAIPC